MKSRNLIIILFLIFNTAHAFGQEQDPILSFPTAAELGSFGRHPVGLFTGTVQVNIPLYEFKTKNLTYPISLNYSSNGFKADKVSSMYGFDWTMSAEGVIIREIRCLPDKNGTFSLYPANLDPSHTRTQEELTAELNYFQNWEFNGDDAEPDIYYFNFCGYSGKFYNDSPPYSGNNIVVPYQNLKIEYVALDSIRITDDKGIQYLFGKGEYVNFGYGYSLLTVATYKIKKIIHPLGDELIFNYDSFTGNFNYINGISDNVSHYVYNGGDTGCPDSYIPAPNFPIANYSNLSGGVIKYLTSISAPGYGEIIFHYDEDERPDFIEPRMTGFSVYNEEEDTIRSVSLYHQFPHNTQFNQSAMVGQPAHSLTEVEYRMFLDSVIIRDNQDSQVQRYAFEYNDLDALPIRLTYAQDHWGYFNGASNYSLLPDSIPANIKETYFSTLDSTRAIANRDANWLYAKKGIISKVIYPTGGYTEFEYEPHKTDAHPNKEHGGLRLKRQQSYKAGGQLAFIETYEYTGGKSGWDKQGIKYYIEKEVEKHATCAYYWGSTNFSIYWLKSKPFYPFGLSDNYDIGYQKVTIYYGDSLINNGKVEHEFKINYDDIIYPEHSLYIYDTCQLYGEDIVLPPNYINRGWKNGTKLSEKYFKNENNNYIPVKEIKYQYTEDTSNCVINYYPSIECTAFDYPPTLPSPQINQIDICFNVSLYWIISKWHYLSAQIENTYMNGQIAIRDTIRYHYDNSEHAQLSRIEKTASTGDVLVSKFRYPSDIDTGVYSQMDSLHMHNYPVEQTNLWNDNVISSALITYKSGGGSYLPDEIFSLETDTPLSSFTYFNGTTKDSHYPSGSYDKKFDYDSIGNIITIYNKDGKCSHYLWAYNKTLPVAKIVCNVNDTVTLPPVNDSNLSKSDVLDDVEDDITYLNSLLTSYISNSNYFVTLFTYKPLVGMTSQTNPNGITTFYQYDDFGRLKRMRDHEYNILQEYEYHYANDNP